MQRSNPPAERRLVKASLEDSARCISGSGRRARIGWSIAESRNVFNNESIGV